MRALAVLRTRFVALAHLVLFVLAYWFAFAIRFDFRIPRMYWLVCVGTVSIAVGIKFASFYFFAQYRNWLRYVSMQDMKSILAASSVAELLIVAFDRFLPLSPSIPRSVFLLDWGLTVALVGGARVAARVVRESPWPLLLRNGLKRVFIVGAGDAGEGLLRELRRRPELNYLVVGFLDDDPRKRRARIGSISVLGTIDEAPGLARTYDVRDALIAIPSAPGRQMRSIVKRLRAAGLSFRTLPGVARTVNGKVDPAQLRNVDIEELLGRQPVKIDMSAVGVLLRDRTVMITGAGGSIGSELCRQALRFEPRKLVLIDWSENSLFKIDLELRKTDKTDLVPCVADVGDELRIDQIFSEHKPEVVFHAAAHKHVPLMEHNACEAAKNNVAGTKVIADVSIAHDVEEFVLISTDKATNPVGIMGMTKRLAELYVHALGQARGAKMVSVRFGNVLGSSGSVVPIFKEQIEKGGPVTVTHPEMVRYFMTIPEAVGLVLQAATMGRAGEILVLDMGEPVRIVDLARELIALSGLREPEDIQIEFIGPRPGEKMSEELHGDGEEFVPSSHESIRVARGRLPNLDMLLTKLPPLREAAIGGDEQSVRRMLIELTSPKVAAPETARGLRGGKVP